MNLLSMHSFAIPYDPLKKKKNYEEMLAIVGGCCFALQKIRMKIDFRHSSKMKSEKMII